MPSITDIVYVTYTGRMCASRRFAAPPSQCSPWPTTSARAWDQVSALVLYCAVQYSTVLYLYCTTIYPSMLLLYYIVLVLYSLHPVVVPYCTILYFTVLYYTLLVVQYNNYSEQVLTSLIFCSLLLNKY